jgi:hypothetical protein
MRCSVAPQFMPHLMPVGSHSGRTLGPARLSRGRGRISARSEVRQTVRHHRCARAHASPPRRATALGLTCGKAENSVRQISIHHLQHSRDSAALVGYPILASGRSRTAVREGSPADRAGGLGVGCSRSVPAVCRVHWCEPGRPPGAQRRGPLARPRADRESGRPTAYPSHSPRIPCNARAVCSSRRSTQQFARCGFTTITPSSLVKSKLVNPAAPCAWQVVMSTRRWPVGSCLGGTVVTFRGRFLSNGIRRVSETARTVRISGWGFPR